MQKTPHRVDVPLTPCRTVPSRANANCAISKMKQDRKPKKKELANQRSTQVAPVCCLLIGGLLCKFDAVTGECATGLVGCASESCRSIDSSVSRCNYSIPLYKKKRRKEEKREKVNQRLTQLPYPLLKHLILPRQILRLRLIEGALIPGVYARGREELCAILGREAVRGDGAEGWRDSLRACAGALCEGGLAGHCAVGVGIGGAGAGIGYWGKRVL